MLIIARDIVIVIGTLAVHYLHGSVEVHPSWTGKTATALQMVAISLCMLQLNFFEREVALGPLRWPLSFLDIPVYLAGFFTLISGAGYLIEGIRHLHSQGHGDPKSPA